MPHRASTQTDYDDFLIGAPATSKTTIHTHIKHTHTLTCIYAPQDINADGVDDFLIGAPATSSATAGAGAAYVIFGNNSVHGFPANIDVEKYLRGRRGFKIVGSSVRTRTYV